jgi:hypothetical protein
MGTGDLDTVRIFVQTVLILISSISVFTAVEAEAVPGFIGGEKAVWHLESHGKLKTLEAREIQVDFPGGAHLFTRRAPAEMKLSQADFKLKRIFLKLRSSGSNISPKMVFYLKDKDGNWFQTRREYVLKANTTTTVEVLLDTFSQAMLPVGHHAAWNATARLTACEYGLNIYSASKGIIRLELLAVKTEYRNKKLPLRIVDWHMPGKTKRYGVTEGTFELSREYFNPFDPENIEINVRAQHEDGTEKLFPAYYTLAHTRGIERDREAVRPLGSPYWAYRFTPGKTGKYKFCLEITDRSGEKPETLISPEREITVLPSADKGFVRVSKKDPMYFEFADGSIFFPLGFNIHTPKDRRYEQRMKDDKIFDLGATAYERYFEAMKRNGLNACEIWMASWSMGIEWTNRSRDYYGLGRYNLAHAAQLDAVLESARKNGIYIHLVLDNHGKLSSHCDQEWQHSPFNRANPYAVADRACIDAPAEFFSNPQAVKFNNARNRYIAARWGAYPNIFSVELWSEVDLVTGHSGIYDNGISGKWHNDTAKHFKKWSQGRQPVTTHTCGTFKNTLKIEKLFHLPEIDFIVSDAYKRRIAMVDYMREHIEQLKHLPVQPRLITEFGLVSDRELPLMRADLHSALWASLFFGFAGAPFNWWHEFIHTKGHYQHFRGLANYLKFYDPRGKGFVYSEHPVASQQELDELIESLSYLAPRREFRIDIKENKYIQIFPKASERIRAISFGNGGEEFVWVFKNNFMEKYPSDEEIKKLMPLYGVKVVWDKKMEPGKYQIDFYDTITGEVVESRKKEFSGKRNFIVMPSFKIDMALRISSVKSFEKK